MNFTAVQLSVVSYLLAVVAFGVFALQAGLRSRKSARSRLFIAALAFETAWAIGGVGFALVPGRPSWIAYQGLDALRIIFWTVFLGTLFFQSGAGEAKGWWHTTGSTQRLAILATAVAAAAGAAGFALTPILHESATDYVAWASGAWVVACVIALMFCEHAYRSTPEARRWGVKPLCLALGAAFAYDLVMFSDAMLIRDLDQQFWAIRGLIHALTVPLLMMAAARNRAWALDVAVSRNVVFGSTALVLSGLYMLAVASAGYYVRVFGGEWGKAIQIVFLFAAFLVLGVLFLSGSVRARLRVFISKNFFSYRYDYREEWLRFTAMLAEPDETGNVYQRCIQALSNLVESAGGALWLIEKDGVARQCARWNMPAMPGADVSETAFLHFLRDSGWIVDVTNLESLRTHHATVIVPEILRGAPSAWLIIPLQGSDGLMGFVLLTQPRVAVDVNWEVLDLLKAAARQAAAFLGHVRATNALVEAEQLNAFSRMSAFVVHDLKNLVAQLQLMMKNAERHAANPEFQKDMLATIEHVVERMNRLLMQLRSGAAPIANPIAVDVGEVIGRIGAAHRKQGRDVSVEVAPRLRAIAHEERLERVIGHLVQNALDATPPHGKVAVSATPAPNAIVIEVTDNGIGMTEEFVERHLFRPFHSSKETGMGIGAYECQQYLTELGGKITVDSKPGVGTRFRIDLPAAPEASSESRPHVEHA